MSGRVARWWNARKLNASLIVTMATRPEAIRFVASDGTIYARWDRKQLLVPPDRVRVIVERHQRILDLRREKVRYL